MAQSDNAPSDRPPSGATPDQRPGQRSRLVVVVGLFVAIVVIALVVWLVIYNLAS